MYEIFYYRQVTTDDYLLGCFASVDIQKSVQILKPRNFCRAMLSAEYVCRTDNFLDRKTFLLSLTYFYGLKDKQYLGYFLP